MTLTDSTDKRRWALDLLLLTLVIGGLFLFGLGERPITVTSEARYAELPREMLQSGDWVTPRLNGLKYFEKPPLFYWVQTAFYAAFGYGSEFLVRLPTALFALLGCLITYVGGRALYGRLAGIFAATTLATSILWYALSRVVLLDVPVGVFIALTLFAFIVAVREVKGWRRDLWLFVMYAAAAGAVLTKGLIGALLPGLVIFIWFVLTGRWSLLREVRLIPGAILVLALTVPWHWLAAERNADFLRFYFVHEHWERFLTKEHNRYQPAWFFLAILAGGWLPWTVLLPQAARFALARFWQDRKTDGTGLFLVLWIVLITGFFSISDSKLPPYITPVFPAVAVILGRYLAAAFRGDHSFRFRTGALAHHALFPIVAIAATVAASVAGGKVRSALDNAGGRLIELNVILGIATLALILLAFSRQRAAWVVGMVIASGALCIGADRIAARMVDDSVKPLALTLKAKLPSGTEVASYQHYYQDLPFYLDRTVSVVDWLGELEFGTRAEPALSGARMYDTAEFWRRWASGRPMAAVMRRESYEALRRDAQAGRTLIPIAETGRNVAIVNGPLP